MEGMTLYLRGKNGNPDVTLRHVAAFTKESLDRPDGYIEPHFIVEDETGEMVGIKRGPRYSANDYDLIRYEDNEDELDGEPPYGPEARNYSAACPWNAPGMRVSDFL